MSDEIDRLIQSVGLPNRPRGFDTTNSGFISGATVGLLQAIPATAMANRKQLIVWNSGATSFWVCGTAGASGSGILQTVNTAQTFSAASGIFMVPLSAGQTLSYIELG